MSVKSIRVQSMLRNGKPFDWEKSSIEVFQITSQD